jgi:hypothetical protein
MRKAILTAFIAALSLSAPAWAHNGEHHEDHAHVAPHGGEVRTVTPFHFELVTKGKQVQVYLLDDALKPLPAKGHKGFVVVQMDGKTRRVDLQPSGEAFTGSLDLSKAARYAAVVSLDIDGKTYRGRFSQPAHGH